MKCDLQNWICSRVNRLVRQYSDCNCASFCSCLWFDQSMKVFCFSHRLWSIFRTIRVVGCDRFFMHFASSVVIDFSYSLHHRLWSIFHTFRVIDCDRFFIQFVSSATIDFSYIYVRKFSVSFVLCYGMCSNFWLSAAVSFWWLSHFGAGFHCRLKTLPFNVMEMRCQIIGFSLRPSICAEKLVLTLLVVAEFVLWTRKLIGWLIDYRFVASNTIIQRC